MYLDSRICQYYQNYRLPDIEQFLQKNLTQVRLLYPLENQATFASFCQFYQKFYHCALDSLGSSFVDFCSARHLIFGINPGRLGAGITGVQFTDTIRLAQDCGIAWHGPDSREPSAEFIYKMIAVYGRSKSNNEIDDRVALFYNDFLIQSLLPLGFIRYKGNKKINFNFYENKELLSLCLKKIVEHIQELLSWDCFRTDTAFCLGSSKNFKILQQLNQEFQFFDQIIALEHPRYIMQYKYSQYQQYIDKYCQCFLAVR